jgi:hypothetical protein
MTAPGFPTPVVMLRLSAQFHVGTMTVATAGKRLNSDAPVLGSEPAGTRRSTFFSIFHN